MNLIDPDSFSQGSLLHFFCLLGTALVTCAVVFFARRARISANGMAPRGMRIFLVVGCVAVGFLGIDIGILSWEFRWSGSLPLQFCNLATFIAAVAVATQHRIAQSILYFWTLALSSWAYLTPSLYVGPAHAWFWIFWGYHLFILIALAWVLAFDRFRPDWTDWRKSVIITLFYSASLALLNYLTGWNYGFLGPEVPSQPNLLDFLGPYPIRLLWMVLIGTALFTLLMIPWMRPRAGRSN